MKHFLKLLVLVLALGIVYYYLPTSVSKSQWRLLKSASEKNSFWDKKYAVLIDYGRPVFSKRLWLVELSTKKVLLNCHVSHALNSGYLWANNFSNKAGSEFSCTGMFKTLNDYESQYGSGIYKLGLRIEGLDSNNNNALKRNIVFHSSFPLWSKGCFMTSQKNNKFIIEKLGAGSLVLVLP